MDQLRTQAAEVPPPRRASHDGVLKVSDPQVAADAALAVFGIPAIHTPSGSSGSLTGSLAGSGTPIGQAMSLCGASASASDRATVASLFRGASEANIMSAASGASLTSNVVSAASHCERCATLAMRVLEMKKEVDHARAAAIREIKESNAARDNFIATISHEIRTPLTSLIAAVQLLTDIPIKSDNAAKISHFIEVQKTCGLQLLELINDILDFCKLRSATFNLNEEPMDVDSIVRQSVSIFEQTCASKGVTLEIHSSPAKAHYIGDAKRLRQIIVNLISNAVKFTDVGRITLTVRCVPAGADIAGAAGVSGADDSTHMFYIQVKDTGSGISAENLKNVFKPYFSQKKEHWTTVMNGIGLGLAISQELVHLMGGTISVDSDGITGTTATVQVPLRCTDYVTRSGSGATSLAGVPVMIVDDRMEHRMNMTRLVVKWAMAPACFTCTSEAVMALDVQPDRFAIALVDIDLSESSAGDNGAIFAQHVRSKKLPMHLIAVSSVGSTFGGDGLFDHVLVKPITEMQLFNAIQKVFIRRASSALSASPLVALGSRSRSEPMPGAAAAAAASAAERTAERGVVKRVMVVDDDKTNAGLFADMLAVLGYKQIRTAHSAAECLTLLAKEHADLVFMDVVMPDVDGVECTRRIRRAPTKYGSPKIVALTADALDATKHKCLQGGVDFFITKPLTMEDLRNCLAWVSR
jgi:signal transduction histidine kinase/FixJ family two-component response regulator